MKKKKSFFLRILAVVIGLLVIFLILTVLNGTVGNPITAYLATNKIRTYVAETYSEDNLIVNRATYNFKDSSYGSIVHSPTSEDTIFRVSMRNGRIEDDYPYEVANKFTTLRRLEDALNKEVEAVIKEGFPYQMRLIGAKMPDMESQVLTLDMPYHIQKLPSPIEVIVWTSVDKPSYDIMAQRMLELRKLMEQNDLPIGIYSIRLEYPYHEENGQLMPDNFESLAVDGFPAEQLIERPDLPRILEEYAVEKEREGNKVKEAEKKGALDK
ncbi:MAG: hypothetical protein K0S04_3010 [Herbinix sp.]|jgi:hypothetical protein|nr:hypothetical protein [Herbinix sp.]